MAEAPMLEEEEEARDLTVLGQVTATPDLREVLSTRHYGIPHL